MSHRNDCGMPDCFICYGGVKMKTTPPITTDRVEEEDSSETRGTAPCFSQNSVSKDKTESADQPVTLDSVAPQGLSREKVLALASERELPILNIILSLGAIVTHRGALKVTREILRLPDTSPISQATSGLLTTTLLNASDSRFRVVGQAERNGDLFLLIEDAEGQYVFTQRLDDAELYAVFSECMVGSITARDVAAFAIKVLDTQDAGSALRGHSLVDGVERGLQPSTDVSAAVVCPCGLKDIPIGVTGVQWYWQRHARTGCTLELPNERCWCGLLRSEHIKGHASSTSTPPDVSALAREELVHWMLVLKASATACGIERGEPSAQQPPTTRLEDYVTCPDCKLVAIGYKFGRAAAEPSSIDVSEVEVAREIALNALIAQNPRVALYRQQDPTFREDDVKFWAEVIRKAKESAFEEAAKAVCAFCLQGIAVEFTANTYRHHLIGNETPWVVCHAEAIRERIGEQKSDKNSENHLVNEGHSV